MLNRPDPTANRFVSTYKLDIMFRHGVQLFNSSMFVSAASIPRVEQT
jgi:hypothetical protein